MPQRFLINYVQAYGRDYTILSYVDNFWDRVIWLLVFISAFQFDFSGDRKDQKTIERLRAERLEKINELKERTNYYTTQQLIQVITILCCLFCMVTKPCKLILAIEKLKSRGRSRS